MATLTGAGSAAPEGRDNMSRKTQVDTFLEQPEKLDAVIKNKLIERKQWMDIALGITANMDGDRISSTGSKSKMADAVNRCVDMEVEIDAAVDALVEKKKQVTAAIEQLENPQEYDLLHLRYIQGIDLLEIANRWGREYTTVTTCHGRAKKNLEVILEREGLLK